MSAERWMITKNSAPLRRLTGMFRLLYNDLHWPDVPGRVTSNLSVMMFSCLRDPFLSVGLWRRITERLRPDNQRFLVVSRLRTFALWAFCVAGRSVWNSLPGYLRDLVVDRGTFRQRLKTFLFASCPWMQHIRGFTTTHCMKLLGYYHYTARQTTCDWTVWFGWKTSDEWRLACHNASESCGKVVAKSNRFQERCQTMLGPIIKQIRKKIIHGDYQCH